jgi:adenosylhomocysteine nucleosidase
VIVLSFALPEESKGIRPRLAGAKRSGPAALPVIEGRLAGREVTVLHTGMGMGSAALRVGAYLENHTPAAWIAAGFGGALCADLKIGDIVTGENFSDAALLAAIAGMAALPARAGSLISTKEVVETAVQKKDLGRHTGALVVDMETAAIHRLCTAKGIPVLAMRAISDTAAQDLPAPAAVWFDVKRQRPRPLPLLFYLACHPRRIGPFANFVGGIGRARGCLTDFLCGVMERMPEK